MKKLLLLSLLSICSVLVYSQKSTLDKNTKKGIKALESKKYQEALNLFTLSINEFPTAEAYYYRSQSSYFMGDSCSFCKDLKNAAKLNDADSKKLFSQKCIYTTTDYNVPASIKKKYPMLTNFKTEHNKCDSDSIKYFVEKSGDYSQATEISKIGKACYHLDTCSAFVIVENMPSFYGGNEALERFLAQNLIYPLEAEQNEIKGTVYLSYIIEADGSVSTVKIISGIGAGCDEEAVRIVSLMPQWNPGSQNGKHVRVRLNIPIYFNPENSYNPNPYAYLERATNFLKEGDTCNYCKDLYFTKIQFENATAKRLYDRSCQHVDTIRIISDTIFEEFPGYSYSIVSRSFCKNKKSTSHCDQTGKPIQSVFETMPEYPGGNDARNRFLASNIIYPQRATEKGVQGTVYISFYIETDGKVSDIKILSGPGGGLIEESVRVVRLMPAWKPGTRKGKPIRVLFNMPIYFKLQG